jgi:hypothetical protein
MNIFTNSFSPHITHFRLWGHSISASKTSFLKTFSVFLLANLFLIGNIYGQSQTFTNSGTFIVPAGVTNVTVEAWGGGGAGGGATTLNRSTGGGGGGGTYTKATGVSVTFGTPITVTVGAGGAGASAANGGAGGTSTFGAVSAVGGNGGGVNGATTPLNGAGASVAAGVTFSGGAGGTGNATSTSNGDSGGGGGSAGSTGNGGNASVNTAGTGGAGGGGAGAAGRSSSSGDGNNAAALGGGGGGGRNGNAALARTGGNGFGGQIRVTWTCPTVTSLSYASPTCKDLTTLSPTLVATAGGTYSSTAGLSIDATTGVINPSLSTAGTYTVTYGFAADRGCTAVSATASVTINNLSVGGSLSSDQTICSGSSFTALNLSGHTGAIVKWQSSSDAAFTSPTDIANTTTTLAGVALAATTWYRAVVQSGTCTAANSSSVKITIDASVGGTVSSAQTICIGSSFTALNLSSHTGTIVKWQSSSDAAFTSPTDIVNTTTTLTGSALTATTWYRAVVQSGTCAAANSASVKITVEPLPVATLPSPTTACVGTPITINSNLTSGLSPDYLHEWSVTGNTTGATTGGISSNPNSSVTFTGNSQETVNITYKITNNNGCVSPLYSTSVGYFDPPVATSAGPAQVKCDDGSFTLAAQALSAQPIGAVGTWTQSGSPVTITSPGSPTSTVTGLAQGGTVTLTWTVTNSPCTPTSATVTLTNQHLTLVGGSGLTTSPVCSGTSFSYTPSAVGVIGTATPTFAWTRAAISGISNAAVTNGTGGVAETLINTTTAPITVIYVYTISANGCSNAGENVTVVVNPTPQLSSSLTATAICSGTTFSYPATSTTSGATFTWTRAANADINSNTAGSGSGNVSEILTNSSPAPVTVTYTYVSSANGCSKTEDVTVVVNPTSKLNSALTPAAICSGSTFTYPPTSATTTATFTWTRAAVAGISEAAITTPVTTGIVSETLTNTTNTPIAVTYVVFTIANGCSNTGENVVVMVNPRPAVTAMTAVACSESGFSVTPANATNGIVPAGTTYSWSDPSVSGITGAASGSGAANISGTLTNTTNAAINVIYTVTPILGSCAGATFTVTVTVNPKPAVTAMTATICSASAFSVTPVTTTDGIVPAGTTYSWAAPSVLGITGIAAGSAASSISGTLTNTTNAAIDVVYIVTPTSGTCTGATFTVTITVNPKPAVNNLTDAICSEGTFTKTPINTADGVVPAGTTYSWAAPSVSGITGTVASTSGATSISGTLTNTTNAPINVTYTVTPTSGTCTGATFTVIITVNPKPSVNNLTDVICSAGTFTKTPANTTDGIVPAGTTYSWTAPSVSGITGAVASTSGATSISGTLTNTTNAPINVTYTVTPTSGTCTGATFTVIVTVNPKPTLSSTLSAPAICSTATFGYTPTSATTGATFAWTRAAVSGISEAAIITPVTGAISEILTNTTTAPITVTYIIVTEANSCSNTGENVTVIVNPTPTITGTLSVCVDLTTTLIGSGTPATTGAWVSATPTVATVDAVTGVVTGKSAGTSVITFIDINGCTTTKTVTVNANPTTTITGPTFVSQEGCSITLSGGVAGGSGVYSPNLWSLSSGTYVSVPVNGNTTVGVVAATTPVITIPQTVTLNFMTTDSKGCTASAAPFTLTIYPELKAAITGPTQLCIAPSAVATITLSDGITGGNPAGTGTGIPTARTIVWSSSNPLVATVVAGVVTGVAAGTTNISVTVTDANGCSASSTHAVTVNAAPAFGIPATTNLTCNGAANGTISLTPNSGVVGDYTYVWTKDGGAFSATSATPTGLAAGTYAVTITRTSTGCTQVIGGIVINQPNQLTIAETVPSHVNVFCNGGANGSLTVAAGGGTLNYTYTISGPTNITGATSGVFTGLAAGTYIVTVTDGNLCTATTSIIISQPAVLAVTETIASHINVSCNGGADGALTVAATGGNGSYAYAISGLVNTTSATSGNFIGLAAGSYIVTVTDAKSCTAVSTSISISEPAVLTIFETVGAHGDVSCNGGNDGKITAVAAGGNSGYAYTISGPTVNTTGASSGIFTGLAAGSYTITVKDAKLCTATTTSITITEPILLTVTETTTAHVNVTCHGGTNGSLTVATTGGTTAYSYTISGPTVNTTGATSGNFTSLAAGSYTVTVIDAKLCTATTVAIVITEPAAITASISGTTTVCQNTTSPSVTFTGANGTGLYTFTYKIGAAGATQTVTTTGTNTSVTVSQSTAASGSFEYILVSVSSGGCTKTATGTATITVNPAPIVTVTSPNPITICPDAGAFPLSFTTSATGSYFYTLYAGNINQMPSYSTTTASASTPSTTVSISAPNVPALILPDAGNPYNFRLFVTDGNGCSSADATNVANGTLARVKVNAFPYAAFASTPTLNICGSGTTLTVNLDGTNGSTFGFVTENPKIVTYSINGVSQTPISGITGSTASIPVSQSGTYALVSVSDGSSCGGFVNPATITVYDARTSITTQPLSQSVCAGTPVTFTGAAALSPTPPIGATLQYNWEVNTGSGYASLGVSTPSYTFTPTAADNGKQYRLQAYYATSTGLPSCGITGIALSNVATLSVGAPVTGATAGPDQLAIVGTTSVLAVHGQLFQPMPVFHFQTQI